MAGIIWSPLARLHFQRHLTRIARESSARTAEKWAAKFRAAVDTLAELPEIGSPVEDVPYPGLRERTVGPYRIIYRYDGTDCRILVIPRSEQNLSRVLTPEDLL